MITKLSTRKKELFLTVTSNLCLQIVTAICGFILPPLIIQTFGSSINGMVSSITQFIAYLNLVEAGVGGASVAALYKPIALKDIEKRNEILSATVKSYNKSGFIFTALIVILAFVYPVLVRTQVDFKVAFIMVFVLGISGVAEFFLIGKYRVLLTADKKIYVISTIQIVALILSTLVSILLIKLGASIVIIKFVSSIIYLGRFLLLAFYVRKKYLNLDFHETPDLLAIKQSRNVFVHSIGRLVVFNSPLVIITIFCSLEDVSVYAVYAMVFNAVNMLLGAFSNGMQAFLGESLVQDSLDNTRRIFYRYEKMFFCIEGMCYALTYVLILPFMNLYTSNLRDTEYFRPDIAILFLCIGILNNTREPSNKLIDAAAHFKKTQWRSVLEAIINVFASIIFTLLLGFKGVLLGGICSYLYRTLDILIYSAKHILQSNPLKDFIPIFIWGIYYFGMSKLILLKTVTISSYLNWIIYACIVGLIMSVPILVVSVIKLLLGRGNS